jgi:hypothetical protein
MSLLIDPGSVEAVLLADGWHTCDKAPDGHAGTEISTFYLDAYEYGTEYETPGKQKLALHHGGGQSGICATGFSFCEGGAYISGPLTSVLAVRHMVE